MREYSDYFSDPEIEALKDQYMDKIKGVKSEFLIHTGTFSPPGTNSHDKLQRIYNYACELYNRQKYSDVIDQCIEIIKTDKEWNKKSANDLIISVFKILGDQDPKVIEARKKLAKLMF